MTVRTPLQSNNRPGGPHVIQDMRLTTGTIFYVHSGTGSSTNNGLSPDTPMETVNQAIALCTASKGDMVFVMPGHAETISAAAGIALSKIGISVIGLGTGRNRPVITFTTSTAATLTITAASCRLSNIVFLNDIDEQVLMVGVTAADVVIEDCEFWEGSSKQWLIAINVGTGADRCTIQRCYFQSITAATAANSAITIAAAVDRLVIRDNEVFGDFGNACIHNPTGVVATRLSIRRNSLTNLQSGDHAIELVSACTGVIEYNTVNSTLAAAGGLTAIDQGACFVNQNYGVDATADVSGLLNPVADS